MEREGRTEVLVVVGAGALERDAVTVGVDLGVDLGVTVGLDLDLSEGGAT